MSDEYDTTEKVEQTTSGYKLSIRSQRGTDVRNEDTVSITAHYDSKEDLEAERQDLAEAATEEMTRLRANQPDEDDEAEGGDE